MRLAWGAKVSGAFGIITQGICVRLRIAEPSWLMACMAFETGETFSPSITNKSGSGAVGLIQFMPQTAFKLGTDTEALAGLSAEMQLHYVEEYFKSWRGKLLSLGDVYGAILWPGMIGKSDSTVIFDQANALHPKLYIQNKGLDFNKDGLITKAEIVSRVQRELDRGLLPENSMEIT